MTPKLWLISKLDDEVNMGHIKEVQRLLRAGADINGRNVVGETPLMAAAHTGQPDMVRLLLRSGADAALTDRFGETALQVAQRQKHVEVVDAFTELGAV